MNIIFRVDASRQIGAGHLMRCLTLADALRVSGARCHFLCRDVFPALQFEISSRGHEITKLEEIPNPGMSVNATPHQNWLGVSQGEDARQCLSALSGLHSDWLVVDHYALDSAWERTLRNATRKILVIDDLADRMHDCDVLLDQNFYIDAESRYLGKVPQDCRLLLGPRNALLRDEFATARAHAETRSGAVRRLLVFFGGVDAANLTGRTIQALTNSAFREVAVDVVIGSDHPNQEEIEIACKKAGFALHVQTRQIAKLMAAADLSVGAGGSATWERCCVGLPTMAISVARNQDRLVHDCAMAGALYAFDLEVLGSDHIELQLRSLMENPLLRESISRNAMSIVDGQGTRRVLRSLGIVSVVLRSASAADSKNLFDWRNHPAIRRVSRSSAPLDAGAHARWVASVLSDPCKALLIGEKAGQPVGVVRFDISGDAAEVSIYTIFDQKHVDACGMVANSRGLGADLLTAAEAWLTRNKPEVRCINAEVLGENHVSHALFQSTGYMRSNVVYTKRIN